MLKWEFLDGTLCLKVTSTCMGIFICKTAYVYFQVKHQRY